MAPLAFSSVKYWQALFRFRITDILNSIQRTDCTTDMKYTEVPGRFVFFPVGWGGVTRFVGN